MLKNRTHKQEFVPAHATSREAAEDAIRLSKEGGIAWDAANEQPDSEGRADDDDCSSPAQSKRATKSSNSHT